VTHEAPLGLPLPLSGATRVFAIIGDPIDQAGSPGLFNQAFRKHSLPAVLVPLQVPASALGNLVSTFRQSGNWDGLVITVPHKVAMCSLVDELGPGARRTGAVNAIRKDPDGRLTGDNFDGEGFLRGLAQKGHSLQGKRILMVGAGGAGRAIAHAVADAGAVAITLVDRDVERAEQLAAAVCKEHPNVAAVGARPGQARPSEHGVIVNAAPPSGQVLPVDLSTVEPGTLVVDIVLKPAWTPLLADAASRGLPAHEGIHMLSGQVDAVLAFFRLQARTTDDVRA
jgi:shikimate dehydrogenase